MIYCKHFQVTYPQLLKSLHVYPLQMALKTFLTLAQNCPRFFSKIATIFRLDQPHTKTKHSTQHRRCALITFAKGFLMKVYN